jgi:hypothetical protein
MATLEYPQNKFLIAYFRYNQKEKRNGQAFLVLDCPVLHQLILPAQVPYSQSSLAFLT